MLALRGVNVVMAVRNVEAGENAKRLIRTEIKYAKLHVMHVDVSSLQSVHDFCNNFMSMGTPLNILMYVYTLLCLANSSNSFVFTLFATTFIIMIPTHSLKSHSFVVGNLFYHITFILYNNL